MSPIINPQEIVSNACRPYYDPKSLKANLSRKGIVMMKDFNENSISWEECGKVVVATEENEIERLDKLYKGYN